MHGGKRKGAGRPRKIEHEPTRLIAIRLNEQQANMFEDFKKRLDEETENFFYEKVTNSRLIIFLINFYLENKK